MISGVALLLGERRRPRSARRSRARESPSARSTSELIDWYVATGEWRGRSGGYAIQGAPAPGSSRAVEGEEENVVGLPLLALRELAPELFGADSPAPGG